MLRLSGVSHAYADVISLRDVNLDVEEGEILCLLGPSGCGKTTLLRIVAGLETEYSGEVTFDGKDMRQIPVHQRQFGLMFQDFALFPHMSVAENVAYGLKRGGYGKSKIAQKVQDLLKQVGLEGLGDRDVEALSGGQKQRVALARSLAPNPRLLMLDEPLGSLDAQLRDQLAQELREIIKQEGLSAIYVTHDHREAFAVADRIAVMNIGSVQQHDAPRELYHRPKNAFVARFLGMRNIFSLDDGLFRQRFGVNAKAQDLAESVLIHPAGIHLAREPDKSAWEFEAVLKRAVFRGGCYDVRVELGDGISLSFATSELRSRIEDAVTVYIAKDAIKPLASQP